MLKLEYIKEHSNLLVKMEKQVSSNNFLMGQTRILIVSYGVATS